MRSTTFCLVVLLLLTLNATFISNIKIVSGKSDLHVPSQYPTIQAAINAAAKNDNIIVAHGTYNETLEVTQEVNIIGENKYTTIIDGQESGIVIDVQKDVYITGFTIRNGGNNDGIQIASIEGPPTIRPTAQIINNIIANNSNSILIDDTSGNTVVNNIILNSSISAVALSASSNNNVSRNTITEGTYGIKIAGGTNNKIIENTILDRTTAFGIILSSSTGNTITGNKISSQHRGIYADKSDSNTIDHNTITDSAEGINIGGSNQCTITYNNVTTNAYGIRVMTIIGPNYSVWVPIDNFIKNNIVTQNDWGIELFSVIDNTFIGNWISNNTYGVFISYPQTSATPNVFYYNNFLGNSLQVYQPRLEKWDDNNGKGNHWSDYTGLDDGSGGRPQGDGVGDTRLPHQEVDNYPLMKPWSEHDVGIISVTPSDDNPYENEEIDITVCVKNRGWANTQETFDVTVKYDNNEIATTRVTNLGAQQSTNITFTWNVSALELYHNYTIWAQASVVLDELNTLNNILADGEVYAKITGDVNDDHAVNVLDLAAVGKAYGATPTHPLWDGEADIKKDGIIDVIDLGLVGKNYGRTS